MAFNTSQFQTGAFGGNQFGNYMSGGFTSSNPSTYSKTEEDDTYNPRYPGFNKENYEKLERKVAALGLTGSKKQEVMDEFYRQILPQVENEKKRSKRNEALNQKSYEVSQISDEASRKIAEKNLSVEQLTQMVKEKENLREDAPDAAVFNARIKSIPNGEELLANYMNKGDDTLLYKGGLKKETGWQKAGDVAVGIAQSPGKWGYNLLGQWTDRAGKGIAEGLYGLIYGKEALAKAKEEVEKEYEDGTMFNGREQTNIRTPLLGSEYRANNGWTKAGETIGDIATGIAVTAPIGAALAPAIAGTSGLGAAGIGAVEGGIDTLLTQYGSQGNLDVTPMQMALGIGGGALGGWLSNKLANLPKNQQQSIRKEAEGYINKSIKPTVKGKQNQAAYNKFMDDTLDVADYMSKNKGILQYTDDAGNVVTGELPTNMRETSESLFNMKKYIYDQYNDIAQKAGDAGARVNINRLYDSLDDLTKQTGPNMANPGLVKEIDKFKNQLLQYSDDAGTIAIKDAQETMQHYNKILDAYFNNPGAYANDSSKQIVVATLKRNLADAVDDSIDDALNSSLKGGSSYSADYNAWKQLYSKVKTIEDEVSKRALTEARKNMKGVSSQVIDALAGKEIVEGLLSPNKTGVVKGLVIKGIDAYNKYLNNPNTQLRNLFALVDKANNPSAWTTAMSNLSADLGSSIGSDTLAQIGNATTTFGEVAGNVMANADLD